MKIALIGYGKMGKTIESIAIQQGHSIILKTDIDNPLQNNIDLLRKADVAIEFTSPEIAFENIKLCIENNIPTVAGSTGWLHRFNEVKDLTLKSNGTFFYASNFSIGVNIFFEINKKLAALMSNYPEYTAQIEEIHHTEKKDAPSGTAITLAEGIIDNNNSYQQWKLDHVTESIDLPIIAKRINHVPGTHAISYTSSIDTIEIKHIAHSRQGFAIGALLAATLIMDKKGILGMKDLMEL